ncbi:hypothetical protein PR202_gb00413 [Eleusine coracana subsp. coracana]|uniref:SKP1 component POZ domain-containing protein n=1 Tax=Eleusine coracana subsp. coracana TaxID=191504 RepID=A0AAV5DT16_ELECO|nr:hypothetical protein PR202_gb00413 [Eleusine coracana subsp. coracana]
MIMLKSSDGEEFEIEEAVAMESQTTKHMIEDDCTDNGIPLPNVTATILSKVIEYCKKQVEAKAKAKVESNNDELLLVGPPRRRLATVAASLTTKTSRHGTLTSCRGRVLRLSPTDPIPRSFSSVTHKWGNLARDSSAGQRLLLLHTPCHTLTPLELLLRRRRRSCELLLLLLLRRPHASSSSSTADDRARAPPPPPLTAAHELLLLLLRRPHAKLRLLLHRQPRASSSSFVGHARAPPPSADARAPYPPPPPATRAPSPPPVSSSSTPPPLDWRVAKIYFWSPLEIDIFGYLILG